jgi:hypothetical protein
LKRSSSRRGRSQPVQTRIDTGPWTTKGKQAKSAIGKAWAKFFHTETIPGAKADNPYFVVACKETQKWGKLGCRLSYLYLSCFVVFMYYLCIFIGEEVTIPTSSEIDDTYLDSNEEKIKKHFKKFKEEWSRHGITLMCDSWTGPTGMSIINFMVYCNGVIFFHKSIDATSHSQDTQYIFGVIIILCRSLLLTPRVVLMAMPVYF